ncbi:MAG TPA: sn-glycerol-3-phosphate ABC transporter ATP-binding protein UgpC [Microvirga sp.]|jgi:ABC-type sugar transport system ATPase subunit|nr:sn-glycerol-3-phosphate ABC transporter ATP-binding protein UgpC [Microvirga sp.]
MTGLNLKDIRKSYGKVEVLHGIDLEIRSGEFVVFVGPSGCGKSTLLRLIAGLEDITSGTLAFDGQIVNHLAPSQRGIAMVFQSYALYPHMTVYENMAFGLSLAKTRKDTVRERILQAARMLQIEGYLDRLPKQLSGGQRQRVAIGRAIVRDPKVFLFDEPLSNLDASLRVATRIEIAGLHERMPSTTMIYVTHDQVEAMTLADRIVVLNGGRIEQVGSPMELYSAPRNLFVAKFIGSPAMNIVSCRLGDSGHVTLKTGTTVRTLRHAGTTSKGADGSLGVRPEDLSMCEPEEALFSGRVRVVEQLGEVQLVYVETEASPDQIIAKLPRTVRVERGSHVDLGAPVEAIHVFDASGDAIEPE